MYLQFGSGPDGLNLIIEDDGNTGYAYLIENAQVCGDVWLYNRRKNSQSAEIEQGIENPPRNRDGFMVKEDEMLIPSHEEDVKLKWFQSNENTYAGIFFFGRLVAILAKQAKPGWSKFAIKNSPVAKTFQDLNEDIVRSLGGSS